MIALSVAKLKFSLNKAKKTFLWKVWTNSNVEVCEKVGNVFVMGLRLSDRQVLHKIASSSRFCLDFLARISYFQIFGVKGV